MSYDTWLEQPYEDQAKREEQFEDYWARYGMKAVNFLLGHMTRDLSPDFEEETVLRALLKNAVLAKINEDDIMRWASAIEGSMIPGFEAWVAGY
jgi:hypothetical protein